MPSAIGERLEALFSRLSHLERVRLLLAMIQELTLIAREAYLNGTVDNPSLLQRVNELQHRAAGLARDLVDQKPTPTAAGLTEFIEACFEELRRPRSLQRLVELGERRLGSWPN
jgi:hypothetical protein